MTLAHSLIFGLALFLGLILVAPASHLAGNVLWATILWNLFVGFTGFMIMRTGKVSRWRAIFFIVLAWSFLIHYRTHLLIPTKEAAFKTIPQCHIGIVSAISNYLHAWLSGLFSAHRDGWGPIPLGFLWIFLTLVIGKAWCSWGCFYGGIDEGFSRILKNPKLKWFDERGDTRHRLIRRLRELPAAILLVAVLLSFSYAAPVFCLWICPLKVTSQFLDANPAIWKIQVSLFVAVGVFFLIVLPLLTKKRAFCSFICPFGPWQAFWGRFHPIRLSISPEKCTQCEDCIKACPVFAITKAGLERHEIGPYCNRCGECADICPDGAIIYTIWGQEMADARQIFVFAALFFGGAVGLLFVPELLAGLTGF